MPKIFTALITALVIVFLLNLSLGAARISIPEILAVFLGRVDSGDTGFLIINKIRLPRALTAIACGAALGVAGLLLQTYFANPIVDPYVLGISSGATLFVGVAMLLGTRLGAGTVTPSVMAFGAFAGSLAVMGVVMGAARKIRSTATLLVIGLMTGYAAGAGVSVLSAFAEREQIARFHLWAMGSFAGATWPTVIALYVINLPAIVAARFLSKPLNALALGDAYAKSFGINVRAARVVIILISSLLTASTVAVAGPVSFIGLAVPHASRLLFRTADTRILMVSCVILGAIMASLCDLVARTVVAPIELPLGAVTAVIGVPIVISLLIRRD